MSQPKRTFIIEEFKEYINTQLKRTDSWANDSFKDGLCIALERVLYQAGVYKGYNDNYWLEKGAAEWFQAGQPDFPEKDKYIYGPTGQRYNRRYY